MFSSVHVSPGSSHLTRQCTVIAKASVSPVNAVWKAVEKLYGKPVNAALLFRANKVGLGSLVGKEKGVVGNSKVGSRKRAIYRIWYPPQVRFIHKVLSNARAALL